MCWQHFSFGLLVCQEHQGLVVCRVHLSLLVCYEHLGFTSCVTNNSGLGETATPRGGDAFGHCCWAFIELCRTTLGFTDWARSNQESCNNIIFLFVRMFSSATREQTFYSPLLSSVLALEHSFLLHSMISCAFFVCLLLLDYPFLLCWFIF